jgi:ketosteroid isomerase-like protein
MRPSTGRAGIGLARPRTIDRAANHFWNSPIYERSDYGVRSMVVKMSDKKPMPTNLCAAAGEIRRWLEDFSAAVRAKDYACGRKLFADEVVAFGTRATMVFDLDSLTREQWRPIWGVTRGFRFNLEQARIDIEQEIAWIAAPWASQGGNDSQGWYDRSGRATYILRRREGRWLAVHSHHSLDPHFKVPGEMPR